MTLSQSILSKKYALAYVNVFFDSLQLSDIDKMSDFMQFLQKKHQILNLLSLSSVASEYKQQVLDRLVVQFLLPDSLRKLMQALIQFKQLALLIDILRDISCIFKQKKNIIEVDARFSHDVDDEQRQVFIDFFEKHSEKKVLANMSIDQSLIAGVRLQSSTLFWEYSVAQNIRKLQRSLYGEG